MIIKSATASFGKLENETLRLHEGLNIINAPNESGKSTWCAFIRAMLYGVDSAERARNGHIPDKQKYAPWSGAPMEGTMDLVADRCDITITRTTRLQNAPMREFKATYTGTATEVEGLNGTNAGQLLTGVSREVFRRSAFIEQGTIAISGNSELEKRIASIVSTGEEQVSFSEADARLKNELHRRRYNRNGALPELEGELDEAERRLDSMRDGTQKLRQLESEQEQERNKCAELERKITECRKAQRKNALDSLNRGNAVLEKSRTELDERLAELADVKERVKSGALSSLSAEEAQTQVAADVAVYREHALAVKEKKGTSPVLFLLFLVLAATGAALYIAMDSIAFIATSLAALTVALFFISRFTAARARLRNAEQEQRSILKKYGASDISAVEQQLEGYLSDCALLEETTESEKVARARYEQQKRTMNELQAGVVEALDFSTAGTGAASELARQLREEQKKLAEVSDRLAELRGILSSSGEKLVLESNISYLQSRYETISAQYDALELARSVLKESDDELQSRFSPLLGKQAAEYMSVLTGGKYDRVLIARDFSAMTGANGDALNHDSGYLSAGTADLLYLAVRLAVCTLALPDGETCPLILDDVLVNLDEQRRERAIELLGEIARDRQVILFTCR